MDQNSKVVKWLCRKKRKGRRRPPFVEFDRGSCSQPCKFSRTLRRTSIRLISSFILVAIGRRAMAEPSPGGGCDPLDLGVPAPAGFLEMEVIAGFRVWQLGFMAGCAFMVVIIVLCCIFRCRIPRTKQEIEADVIRKRITKQFRQHIDKLPYENMALDKALPLVVPLEERRMKRGVKILKMTFFQKIKKLFAEENDDDDDSSDGTGSVKSEDKEDGDEGEKGKLSKVNSKDSAIVNVEDVLKAKSFEPKCSIEVTDDDEERATKARLRKSKSATECDPILERPPSKKQISADETKVRSSVDALAKQKSTDSKDDDSTLAVVSAPAVLIPTVSGSFDRPKIARKPSSLELKDGGSSRESKVPPVPPPRTITDKRLSRQSTRLDYDEPTMELEPLPRLGGPLDILSPTALLSPSATDVASESDSLDRAGPFTA